jgi:hypothetical protein
MPDLEPVEIQGKSIVSLKSPNRSSPESRLIGQRLPENLGQIVVIFPAAFCD